MKKIFLLSFIILLIACRKKDISSNVPEVTSGNTEFYFSGKINNQTTLIEAGKDDYYMFSSVDYDNTIQTYLFSGHFKKTTCSSCPNSLKIIITDDTIIPNTSPSHIYNLTSGSYSYLYSDSVSVVNNLVMNIYAVPIYSASTSYQYILDGNSIGNTSNITNYSLSPSSHTLTCIMNNYTDSCLNNALTNILNFNSGDNFYAYFNYSVNTLSNTVTFTINAQPSTVNSYTIYFGDSVFSVSSNTVQAHYYSNPNQIYLAKLVAKSNNGKIWTFQNFVTLNPVLSNCLPNYYYNFTSTTSTAYTPFSKIKIEYTSSDNKVYSSKIDFQPSSSYFTINSIQNYKNNEQNLPVKKVTAQLKCRLFNISNPADFIDIEGNCVFAVAYK